MGDLTDEAPAATPCPTAFHGGVPQGAHFIREWGRPPGRLARLTRSSTSRSSPRPILDAGDPSGRGFREPRAGLLFVGGELAFKSPWTASGKDWCRRGDLNPHVVAHTRP